MKAGRRRLFLSAPGGYPFFSSDCTEAIVEDSVRSAHSGPSQRFLRGLRPLVSVGPLPLPVSAGGHASAITTILPLEYIP